jgi:hypothetical protein
VVANNANAQVSRTYHPNGTLKADILKIRTYTGTDTNSHTYTLGYEYDLNGRRTALLHPSNIAPEVGQMMRTRFTYEASVIHVAERE